MKVIGFDIASEPSAEVYTIAASAIGEGRYDFWTRNGSHVVLMVEPFESESQFVLEWRADGKVLPLDRLPRVVQGIRNVAERLKLYNQQHIAQIKVSLLTGEPLAFVPDGYAVQMATAMAFEDALSKVRLIRVV